MKNIQEFAARKHNKYSIRKFSVGIASILVGSIFFYNNNAQASENQQVQEGSQVTESNANDAQGQSQQQNDRVDATNQTNTNTNEVLKLVSVIPQLIMFLIVFNNLMRKLLQVVVNRKWYKLLQ